MSARACGALLAVTVLLAACGENDDEGAVTEPTVVVTLDEPPGSSPSPNEEGDPSPDGEPAAGELRLWVSNQSFDADPVHVTISIDGDPVVAQAFEVEGQHNWISFDIADLEPGRHTLTAVSDTGAEFERSFRLPADEPRWTVVDYWYYPDDPAGRSFTMHTSDEPIYFM